MNYYWGKPDASVSFCENKYNEKYWVAEYYNTISSVFYIFTGILFIPTRLKRLGYILCCVGFGATLLHGTMRYWGQWVDEISMLVLSFFVLKELYPRLNVYLITPMLLCYGAFNMYFWCFCIMFGSMQIMIANCAINKLTKNKIGLILYILCFLCGLMCWLIDQFCLTDLGRQLQPYQFHAWWHLFTALAIGFGFKALL